MCFQGSRDTSASAEISTLCMFALFFQLSGPNSGSLWPVQAAMEKILLYLHPAAGPVSINHTLSTSTTTVHHGSLLMDQCTW